MSPFAIFFDSDSNVKTKNVKVTQLSELLSVTVQKRCHSSDTISFRLGAVGERGKGRHWRSSSVVSRHTHRFTLHHLISAAAVISKYGNAPLAVSQLPEKSIQNGSTNRCRHLTVEGSHYLLVGTPVEGKAAGHDFRTFPC